MNRPDFACDGRAVVKCPDTHSDIHRIPNKIVLGVIEPEFDAQLRVPVREPSKPGITVRAANDGDVATRNVPRSSPVPRAAWSA